MKLIKLMMLFLITLVGVSSASGQANAYINLLTQNGGQANLGGTVFVEITVGNTGPISPIGINKVRAAITVPIAIASVLPNAQQTGLPPGWTILTNTGSAITVCNGSDVIPVGAQRTILIKVQGNVLGGPSTVLGQLSFGPGTGVCTGPGTLPGDNTVDNSSTSSITVVPANQCTLTPATVSLTGPTSIACFGGTTTLTANSGQPTNIEYSLNGGAFQTGNTFTVPAGTYTVVVRRQSDPACTATTSSITVTQPASALSATASATNTTIIGGNDGTATANPAGGTAGYTYLWSPGGQTTQTATALTAGSYTVTVTDANGCTTTANATVNDPVVTPLSLVDFKAKLVNCQPVLNWITENEINTDRFEIEKSNLSNPGWLPVGVVAANGYTTTKSAYNFIDRDANGSSDQVLYRLKMIDKDGRYKYSKELRVFNNCKTTLVEVYPNPVQKGKLYVMINGAMGYTEATFISLSGQVILKTKMINGTNYLNISNFAAGEYVLNIKDANGFKKDVKVFIKN